MKCNNLTLFSQNSFGVRKVYRSESFDESSFLFRQYLEDIKNISPINGAEMKKLDKDILQGGTAAINARQRLIEGNLRNVVSMARSTARKTGKPLMDLIQDGNMGLIKAANLYNGNGKFMNFAHNYVFANIARAVDDEFTSVRLPVNINEAVRRVERGAEKVSQKLNRSVSRKEELEYLANELGYAGKNSITNLQYIQNLALPVASLDEFQKKSLYKNEFLTSKRLSPQVVFDKKVLRGMLDSVLSELKPPFREAVIKYLGLFGNEKQNFTEMANDRNFTPSAINLRYNRGLQILRKLVKRRQYSELVEFLATKGKITHFI